MLHAILLVFKPWRNFAMNESHDERGFGVIVGVGARTCEAIFSIVETSVGSHSSSLRVAKYRL